MPPPDPADLEPKKETPQSTRWRKVHARAMRRFKLVSEAEDEQRKRELEDLKFSRALPTDHWEEAVYQERQAGGMGIDGTVTSQRPTLVVDKLDQPVTSIVNEARRSRLAILIKPKGDKANLETADVLQGLIRAIEVDSNAAAARMWAYDRAVKCGRGYYRIDVDYANDGDLDLDIRYRLIPNQGSVYVDPFAVEPDRSDMKWAFVTGDYAKEDEYPEMFGGYDGADRILTMQDEALTTINDQAPGWLTKDSVRVAEYYEVEEAKALLVQIGEDKFIPNPPKGYRLPRGVQPLPPGLDVPPDAPMRQVTLRRVMLYLLNGFEILNETPWNGRFVPIVPVYGKIYNVDGETSYQGVITKAKDGQRLYDATVSDAVETARSQSKSPYVAAYGQVERFKEMWDQMNVRNFPVLYYDPKEVNGHLVPPPGRNDTEPRLMGHAMLLQQADADIKATTGRWEASLGQLNPSDRSGKAIQKLQQQAELGSSNFLDQFASISMFYEGKILLDLIPAVYDRPGRIVRVLGEEDSEEGEKSVMLGRPFIETDQGPKPVPDQPPGVMARAMGAVRGMIGGQPPPTPKKYDLAVGQFTVVPSVGPSSQTQREENVAFLQGIIEAVPDVAPQILDLIAENMEGPMGRKIAERLRAMNPQIPQGDKADLPPEAQAIVAQLEQQLQEMGQQLQEAQQALATDQAKQQANLEIARLEAEMRLSVEQLKAQAVIAKVRAEIESDEARARFDAAIEKTLQDDQQAHEIRLETLKAQHQRVAATLAAAHQAGKDARAEGASARADVRKAALAPRPTPKE